MNHFIVIEMILGYKDALSLDLCLVSCSIMREHLREYFTTNHVDFQSVLGVYDVYYIYSSLGIIYMDRDVFSESLFPNVTINAGCGETKLKLP